jgi:hypothetical protein
MPRDADSAGPKTTTIVLIVLGVVFGLVLLVVVACGGIGYLFFRSVSGMATTMGQIITDQQEAQEAAQEFLNDLKAGNVAAAYDATTDRFKAGQTLEQFQAFVKKNPLLTGHTSAVLTGVNHQPAAGHITVKMTLNGNVKGSTTCSLQMAKENGEWKVDKLTVP